jgi:Holliday junction resolvase RusA-like endonuclease
MNVVEHPNGTLGFMIDIPPVPASRPRVGRYGTFYGKTYKKFREQLAELMKEWPHEPMTGSLEVETWIMAPFPKTKSAREKRQWPKGDLDNYEKAVWDGLNGIVWEDDDQIVNSRSYKRFSDNPCIVMTVTPKEI